MKLTDEERESVLYFTNFDYDEQEEAFLAAVASIKANAHRAGGVQALREAAEPLKRAGFQDVPDWLTARADQMEGRNE